jgi:phenylpropionate dioxygenase-like ring-hydroxylating dioxygenase large terminal subunit
MRTVTDRKHRRHELFVRCGVLVDQTSSVFRRCWHPVARSTEVGEVATVVRLLGDDWQLARCGPTVDVRRGETTSVEWAVAVIERYGLVWIAPDTPLTPLVEMPEVDDDAFVTGWLVPTTARASATALIDNFCDVAHFPFVHAGTFGDTESHEVGELRPIVDGWIARVDHEQMFTNHDDPAVERGERPLRQRRRARYTYVTPFTATLRLDHLDAGGSTVILFAVQPVDASTCRIYTVLARDGIDQIEMAETVAFEERVLLEDLRIQAHLPPTVDLDPTAELHTPADRLTLTIRRLLAAFIETAPAGAAAT